ncbi:hypothetical protein NP233_g10384 [Leucocoprinus birnbaumii]|uniref:Tf2-1-like SH3-like domain-containing protein n=1 Tax=Leucocoprinus birnbaumii TaxID=56174 RepID=A0AAD5VKV9_9AGAR|nr:hypothetical protein NP233_g10384 [Leucocoprinus birnbaumii]
MCYYWCLPFFANKGYHPNITVHPECNIASAQAHEFAVNLQELHATLKSEISTAQQCYQCSADVCQIPAPDFEVSQQVLVKAQFFQTTQPSKKLLEKYLSLYKIIACPSTHSFTLHLPNSMHAVHPVFHVSMLKPSTPNPFPNCSEPALAPVVINREPGYKVSQIVDSKIDCH